MNHAPANTFSPPSAHHQTRTHALEDQITELSAHIHAATFRLLELIREYDECNGWEGPGLRSCAHWLNWKCGINLGAAREKVRVAHALKYLPETSTAFRDGRLSYSKVRAMTRVASPQNEDYLLNIAKHGTAAHVERLVRQFRKVKRLEALEHENQRLACDAGVVHWLEDKQGNTLDIGRKSRTIPPSIRRALQRLDGGYRFPGCTCDQFVDAHHIQHWADGGTTCMYNLVLLCRHHHRLVHEGGFGVHPNQKREINFTTPDGKTIPTDPETRFRGNAFALTAQNSQNSIRITPKTTIPQWLGEHMDEQMAVEGMMQREFSQQ